MSLAVQQALRRRQEPGSPSVFRATARFASWLRVLTLSTTRRRVASAAIVILLHLLVLWALGGGIKPGPVIVKAPELEVTVLSPTVAPPTPPAPPISWLFQAPPDVEINAPQIDMAPDPSAPAIPTTTNSSQILPPRPEPGHVNPSPDVPFSLRQIAAEASIIMRVYVLANGVIAEARIQKGSNNADLDQIAMDFVKANWQFMPASRGGRPVEDWTTVMVRFHL